mmetsp:Transcript_25676/g.80367  ORF Transcript_25676/g.80367 Transcript_25676/m.80367 type:complete len:204 (-) Transcript_25676:24-635(-)
MKVAVTFHFFRLRQQSMTALRVVGVLAIVHRIALNAVGAVGVFGVVSLGLPVPVHGTARAQEAAQRDAHSDEDHNADDGAGDRACVRFAAVVLGRGAADVFHANTKEVVIAPTIGFLLPDPAVPLVVVIFIANFALCGGAGREGNEREEVLHRHGAAGDEWYLSGLASGWQPSWQAAGAEGYGVARAHAGVDAASERLPKPPA